MNTYVCEAFQREMHCYEGRLQYNYFHAFVNLVAPRHNKNKVMEKSRHDSGKSFVLWYH